MIAEDSRPKYFIVEGNIGAGKSTFLKLIQRNLGVQVVYEPTDRWQRVGHTGENILEKFYQDTPRWAYTFQTYAFITRILEQEKQAEQNPYGVQILERSVFSDRYCFAKNCYELGFMSSLEWNMYQEWFEWLVSQHLPKPHGFIYLYTDPKVCYNRLRKRNRSEETGVAQDYLNLLHQKHQSWLIDKQDIAPYLHDVPVLTLDCNVEFEHAPDVQEKYMEAIANFCTQHYGLTIARQPISAPLL